MHLLILLSFFLGCRENPKTIDSITVEIKNIRYEKGGNIFLEICDESNHTVKKLKHLIGSKEDTIFIFTNLPFGKYAVRAFHDENNNGKLDKGVFGQPIEGWGVSNDARGFMCAPTLSKMLFMHNSATKISFKLSY